MTCILMTIPRARVNGQAFAGTNYTFIKSGHGDTEVECKRHDLAQEKLHKARDEWNEERMEQLDFINKITFYQ